MDYRESVGADGELGRSVSSRRNVAQSHKAVTYQGGL